MVLSAVADDAAIKIAVRRIGPALEAHRRIDASPWAILYASAAEETVAEAAE